jgi:phosphatidate cytidylyltransferase
MLLQRVITAVVLLAVLLPAVFAQALWPFAVVTIVLIGAAGWEWSRLNGAGGAPALVSGAGVAGLCVAAWLAGLADRAPSWVWWVAMLAWVLGGVLALRAGVAAWPAVPRALRLSLGVLILVVAWLALMHSRVLGINYLLSVLCLVWVADIAAYFAGRTFGRRKLAPAISPGKSWEGVYGGLAGVVVLALAWSFADARSAMDAPSLFGRLHSSVGWVGLVISVVFLAAMSVVGDLFESLVKRSAGAKDSSQLLPGHGGVLDRVDALLPVLPLALAVVAAAGAIR